MSKPINLNQVRKQKARAANKKRADENAVRFGQSKQERARLDEQATQRQRLLDGHKRDRNDPPEGSE
ncbi:MAG: DUF4169 family protein [Neomegalonema sp.]|nr:DUF4169 family protein [Neomegalonema sp.]